LVKNKKEGKVELAHSKTRSIGH